MQGATDDMSRFLSRSIVVPDVPNLVRKRSYPYRYKRPWRYRVPYRTRRPFLLEELHYALPEWSPYRLKPPVLPYFDESPPVPWNQEEFRSAGLFDNLNNHLSEPVEKSKWKPIFFTTTTTTTTTEKPRREETEEEIAERLNGIFGIKTFTRRCTDQKTSRKKLFQPNGIQIWHPWLLYWRVKWMKGLCYIAKPKGIPIHGWIIW